MIFGYCLLFQDIVSGGEHLGLLSFSPLAACQPPDNGNTVRAQGGGLVLNHTPVMTSRAHINYDNARRSSARLIARYAVLGLYMVKY